MYITYRLGMYNAAVNKQWTHTKDGGESFGLGLFWGAAGGAVGAYFASPFLMVCMRIHFS